MTRVSSMKTLQTSVKRFRDEHEDWKSLAAFLLSKQSGRRIKKPKQITSIDKMITNVKAGELMVKSYLQDKLPGDLSDSRTFTDDKENKLEKDTFTEIESKQSRLVKRESIPLPIINPRPSVLERTSSESESSDDYISDEEEEFEENTKLQIRDLDKSDSESDTKSNFVSVINPKSVQKHSHSVSETKLKVKTAPEAPGASSSKYGVKSPVKSNVEAIAVKKTAPVNKKSGEIVVKQLNLTENNDESDITNLGSTNVVLFSEKPISKTKSQKMSKGDSFFLCSDNDEESDIEVDNNDQQSESDVEREDSSSADEIDDVIENQSSKGKSAIRSTFLNSLSDSKRSGGHHGSNRTKTQKHDLKQGQRSNKSHNKGFNKETHSQPGRNAKQSDPKTSKDPGNFLFLCNLLFYIE